MAVITGNSFSDTNHELGDFFVDFLTIMALGVLLFLLAVPILGRLFTPQ